MGASSACFVIYFPTFEFRKQIYFEVFGKELPLQEKKQRRWKKNWATSEEMPTEIVRYKRWWRTENNWKRFIVSLRTIRISLFSLKRFVLNCRCQAWIKTKSSVQNPFFEKSAEMQLLNTNILQNAQTTKYSNKKAQDLQNLVLFVFCSFFVLQRCLRCPK